MGSRKNRTGKALERARRPSPSGLRIVFLFALLLYTRLALSLRTGAWGAKIRFSCSRIWEEPS